MAQQPFYPYSVNLSEKISESLGNSPLRNSQPGLKCQLIFSNTHLNIISTKNNPSNTSHRLQSDIPCLDLHTVSVSSLTMS